MPILRTTLLAALCLCSAGLGGCAVASVAGAAVGTAINVTGAVVSTGVELTGKVIGAGIDAVSPGKHEEGD